MILVADSSSLIALSICDQLDLLEKLFENVQVPISVYKEIDIPDKPESGRIKKFLQEKISKVDLSSYIISTPILGKGELEAMALYKQVKADYLLTDDKQARKVAEYNKIKIVGSMGVLIMAKKQGLIKSIKPSLDAIYNSYIYISEDLYHYVLSIANENG